MRKTVVYISLSVVMGIFYGCASTPHPTPVYETASNNYTSSFPSREVSDQLSGIQNSVQRIISTATYKIYILEEEQITITDVRQKKLDSLSSRSVKTSQSNAGTAISILENDGTTIFITAYHIIESPDTLITYQSGIGIPRQTFIRSVGIIMNEDTYLFNHGMLIELTLMATEPVDDLALLKADNKHYNFKAPPLRIQTGAAKNLQLGSFIYVMGYPLGRPMVTRGIVSAPNYNNQGGFLTDALFNHGISGGLIIASNNNYESFEWVGMSSTASVKKGYFLVPDPAEKQWYDDFDIYADSIYIDRKSFINYGISRAIPIEDILEFLYRHEEKLNDLGLSATDLVGQ